jgi:hypothetical protein
MAEHIDQLYLTIELELLPGSETLNIKYRPGSGGLKAPLLEGSLAIPKREWGADLRHRLETLHEIMRSKVARGEFEIDSEVVAVSVNILNLSYDVLLGRITVVLAKWPVLPVRELGLHQLTPAQQRLLHSIAATADRLAWEDLRTRVGLGTSHTAQTELFLSYRSTIQSFAETLAYRLGQEGIVPFFDKWDIKAGDSVPGEIGEAFKRSIACIIILSADFAAGQWATAEMETALTKHIQEGYRVIPVLYEQYSVPELLKPLRHVDFTKHDPDTFEAKFAEVIDAVYGLELNPFR